MLKQELVDELNILLHYNLTTTLEGIKIHKSADASVIDAVERMFHKGLVTRHDGGYLTDLGRAAAEHAQACYTILTSG
ncbi:TIGR02647 family protein [Methylicorpusculum oleiharenae]|uniref:TIGR02647 family protein n=1 Tax=Methylicorpusculum oleiharenae TaxID=1338687 RepID=UPI0013569733|nr:TIGR02647 family protein [Methylicorpusculum oleiharenae]MCD2451236.1 TIGR02647 family protein [Methylicorpusculum oleiharenae]